MKTFTRILCVCISMVLLTSCTAHIPVEPETSPIPTSSTSPDSSSAASSGASAPTTTPNPTAVPSPVQSRTFDPAYFIQEFSRSTTRAVLEENFPDLREQLDPPHPSDPEDLILISEGWSYEGVPGVVLFTCDEGVQLRSASFHGYGPDFKKALAMRDALQQQLEQTDLWKNIRSGKLSFSDAIDMNDNAKWVPFSEDADTLPSHYVISTVMNFSHPSVSLTLLYAGEEAAPRWYAHIYKATGELEVRTQANPATEFSLLISYLSP